MAPAIVLGAAFVYYLFLFLPLLDGHHGEMGADYAEFLPRLLGEYFWFRKNSWFAIPWFTPAFCGGMPEWANPQAMPYSLPQALVFFFDPVTAVQATFAAYALAGMVGMWLLARGTFQSSRPAATLASVLFLFNSFFMARTVAGHLAMHPFMLAPGVGWLISRSARTRGGRLLSTLAAAFLIALMLEGGMLVVLPPVVLSWIAIGLIQGIRTGSTREVWLRLAGALLIAFLLSASKLAATSALVAQFPRDQYSLPGFKDVSVLLQSFFSTLFWRGIPEPHADFVGFNFIVEIHERQYGLSPVPLAIFALSIFLSERWPVDLSTNRNRLLTGLLLFLFLIPLAVNLHADGWTQFLKSLPVLKSSSSLTRWYVLYVLIFPVLTAAATDHLPRPLLVASMGVAGVILWNATANLDLYVRPYNAEAVVHAWTQTQAGVPVPSITTLELPNRQQGVGRDDALTRGACQIICIEPLFGYREEKLPWHPLHPGAALDAADGVLNIKDPRCELFPVENRCTPGTQFPESSAEEATAFLSWKPLPFERSTRQSLADGVNVLALLLFLGGLTYGIRSWHREHGRSDNAVSTKNSARSHSATRKAS
jgi:hypothetical protein